MQTTMINIAQRYSISDLHQTIIEINITKSLHPNQSQTTFAHASATPTPTVKFNNTYVVASDRGKCQLKNMEKFSYTFEYHCFTQ